MSARYVVSWFPFFPWLSQICACYPGDLVIHVHDVVNELYTAIHTLADLESFLHVLSWVASQFTPHGLSSKRLWISWFPCLTTHMKMAVQGEGPPKGTTSSELRSWRAIFNIQYFRIARGIEGHMCYSLREASIWQRTWGLPWTASTTVWYVVKSTCPELCSSDVRAKDSGIGEFRLDDTDFEWRFDWCQHLASRQLVCPKSTASP
jgi:hypothetical protein